MIPFAPPPEQLNQILSALCDPNLSFDAVATKFETSADALAAWMESPETVAILERHEQACARRLKLLTTSILPAAVAAIKQALEHFAEEAQYYGPFTTQRPEAQRIFRTARAAALSAGKLLLALTNFAHPKPASTSARKPNLNCRHARPQPGEALAA